MKNKKGFTLIELLAVIVILAVIALIATPIILNMIEDAKKSSAKDSAYGYIKAIEYETSLADLKGKKYEDKEDYTYNEIKVNIKGEAPTGGKYSLKNGVVTSGVFCINGYTVNYENSIATIGDKGCTEEDLKNEDTETLSTNAKLGDYISMTPTSTSYNVSSDLTGLPDNSVQTINPSELNLWRVIKINSDGTIEIVSENVSSVLIHFYGQEGYLKSVGSLNTIANQYQNTKYTIKARHMGYNGQTETITDTSKFTYPASWTSSTSDNSNEKFGGGDMLYEADTNLVKNAIGTLGAKKVGGSYYQTYYLASRYYLYNSPDNYMVGIRFATDDKISDRGKVLYNYSSSWIDLGNDGDSIRPILTLRSGLPINGSGTIDQPYVLS